MSRIVYVTGNLQLPKKIEGCLPATLNVRRHGTVEKSGIHHGAKSDYQHHGATLS